jgi:hypothetical protein
MSHVYVAGPLTNGHVESNVRRAVLAGDELLCAGLHPYVPHLSFWHDQIAPHDYETWMTLDFAWLAKCDALVRLPGPSSGADREVVEARRLGIRVFHSTEDCIAWFDLEEVKP